VSISWVDQLSVLLGLISSLFNLLILINMPNSIAELNKLKREKKRVLRFRSAQRRLEQLP